MTSQQFQVHCRVTKWKVINQSVQYSLQTNSILAKQGNASDSCKCDSLFPISGTAMQTYDVILIYPFLPGLAFLYPLKTWGIEKQHQAVMG